ncbi:PQQ-dependent catabolism-associated CXXCW motif protein [Pseudomonas cuatrocienegasensis]|uniref:PQQ-dependent catabolism-associated CXXCW motif protein n=1 Tax=Pseudomonas cuatrocienegasensis TaxID=543360 RepID=A0ABY1BKH9_9PSED|nr:MULTISPECIES: PQQ-dependent catabolism-associated CXXCW motif protein [Pseudomonas]OEC34843.1 sulfurtransferase [Pseudomonas sp. 21C1]SER05232.1 PQQ-dependent catabolism-associated CXXCW motif protein [Pseudomonas cuatrocienegasensis]
MKYRLPLCAGLLGTALWLSTAAQAEALFDAEGYRSSQYRSPTPSSLDGVQTLDTASLQRLLSEQSQTRLIDVYRRPWLQGRFIEDAPHANLPGSLWLANTGEGNLAPQWQRYLRHYLQQAREGDALRPLVFYCRSDCWLSWNAARRAHGLGYRQLYWYRDGIDAWQQAGLPLVPAQPAELPSTLLTPAATP